MRGTRILHAFRKYNLFPSDSHAVRTRILFDINSVNHAAPRVANRYLHFTYAVRNFSANDTSKRGELPTEPIPSEDSRIPSDSTINDPSPTAVKSQTPTESTQSASNPVAGGSSADIKTESKSDPSSSGHAGTHKLFDGSAIGSATMHYTHEINRVYSELEKNLMQRINESNQRRFRIILLSTVLFITWIGAVFGTRIRKMLSDQTAGLAKETLENESLKVQTQELAMAVVNTVLNDKEVTAHAASFLREASVVPETQQALLQLTLHVLQHPDTLEEATTLAKKLITVLAKDKVRV
jgi:hypothetical protein